MAMREDSLSEQILRAAAAISETAKSDENVLLAKQQLMAAYESCQENDIDRVADHLCLAVQALIQDLHLKSSV